MSDVTQVLNVIEQGGHHAPDALLPMVYDELRRLAAVRIAAEGPRNSLQATALVHEAYVRLVDTRDIQTWESRGHFFAAAAEAMRRILIDRARRRNSAKRGGDYARIELSHVDAFAQDSDADLLRLNSALESLKSHDAQAFQLVMLRYFGGLGHQEAAASLGIRRRTADRLWAIARVWLREEMHSDNE